jgi:hypothetical protein
MADYGSQQNSINRRRQLAAALQQQSMMPIEMPQTPGANVSWSQGAAKIAQALFAGLGNRKLDKQQGELDTAQGADRSAQIAAVAQQLGIDPSGMQGMASSDPVQQQIAQMLAGESLRRQGETRGNDADMSRLTAQQDFQREQREAADKAALGLEVSRRDDQRMQRLSDITEKANDRYVQANKPIEVSQGASLMNQQTGQVLGTAPGGPASQRNIDPLSPEGIEAAVEREKRMNAVKPAPGENPLTTQQRNLAYLRITDKYQADPILKSAQKMDTAVKIADDIIKDPGKASNQLAALYTFVKVLDNYDSTVREGEVSLAQLTQSHLQNMQQAITRVSKGQVISPEATKELAEGTKRLVKSWQQSAKDRTRQYQSQAQGGMVGKEFDEYLQRFQATEAPAAGGAKSDPLGIR